MQLETGIRTMSLMALRPGSVARGGSVVPRLSGRPTRLHDLTARLISSRSDPCFQPPNLKTRSTLPPTNISQEPRRLPSRHGTACRAVDYSTIAPSEETSTSGGYPFEEIEAEWQKYWDENQTFRTPEKVDTSKPKCYVLDMFPYPSGAGLHVGHPEGYTATDIVARYKRMTGHNVLHPMGWDAFGLPAEQYAIETGTHPRETTFKNVDRFRHQLKSLGFSYDWEREVSTTDPEYYKWTQWIFLKLLEKGLAYQASVPVNWCPALGTVLANEEVIDGKSERGGHPVIRRPMRQWMLKITAYADRLLDDLDDLDWPDSVKDMQRNWIGRSVGAEINFKVKGAEEAVTVFTTRPDTLFGATYMVLAPEHPAVADITTEAQRAEVDAYVAAAANKSDLERTDLQKHKTGVFTGATAVNPINGEEVPVWVADYVLGGYGSGAVMAVPAHDSRDHEFAMKYGLEIKAVVAESAEAGAPDVSTEAYTGPGVLINSANPDLKLDLEGVDNKAGGEAIVAALEGAGAGAAKVNYKLRDWLFARQRYWGEPFPVMFEEGSDEPIPVPVEDLPVELPETESFLPREDGQPPLSNVADWVHTTSPAGNPAMRETNTMPQWAGSCWYYLRFIDPKNGGYAVDPDLEKYWMPVDLYVGGAEHSVLHLLYARFWHKFLYDCGVVTTKEPFQRLVNQGMILGEVEYTAYQDAAGAYVSADAAADTDELTAVKVPAEDVEKQSNGKFLLTGTNTVVSARAHKMSKSRGNVVNPDDIVSEYGADSLRLYEMFMGPLKETKVWSTNGVEGVHRFLARTFRLFNASITVPPEEQTAPTPDQLKLLHSTIKKVTEETEGMRFNTAISAMMEFVNAGTKMGSLHPELLAPFALLLSPYAPHLAEHLWRQLGNGASLAYEGWPAVDESLLVEATVKFAVQVNGKVRGTIEVAPDADEDTAVATAVELETMQKWLDGKNIVKTIYRPGKILNLIVK